MARRSDFQIRDRLVAVGRVDDELDLAVADGVFDMRTSLENLVDLRGGDAVFSEEAGGAAGRENLEALFDEDADRRQNARLVFVAHGNEDRAFTRQFDAGAEL